MLEKGRCTGRTKRMIISIVADILNPDIKVVYIIGHNRFMTKNLLKDVKDIIAALHLNHIISSATHDRLELLDTEVYTTSSHRELITKLKFTKERYTVHKDHFVDCFWGTYPLWRNPKLKQTKKTKLEKFVDKFWSLIP